MGNFIELKRTHIKALSFFTASEDVRSYLMGVCFKNEGSNIFGYATNGHIICRYLVANDFEGEDFEIVISNPSIKHILIASKKDKSSVERDVDISISLDVESPTVFIKTTTGSSCQNQEIPIQVIDGIYPKPSKVYNQSKDAVLKPNSSIMFSNDGLKILVKASKALSGKSHKANIVFYNPLDADSNLVAFEGVDDIACVVMSLRISDREKIKNTVILDEYVEPDCKIKELIDSGEKVLCAVSNEKINRRMATRKINPYGLRRIIVDCDDDCYLDDQGDIWKYAVYV